MGAQKGHKRGQKEVQGKKEHGSSTRMGRRGNRGSKGQNLRQPSLAKEPGPLSRDEGDQRGPHGGSGGGQSNRQNRSVNRAHKMG